MTSIGASGNAGSEPKSAAAKAPSAAQRWAVGVASKNSARSSYGSSGSGNGIPVGSTTAASA